MKFNAKAPTMHGETHTSFNKQLGSLIATVLLMAVTTNAHALLSEPQNIFYGEVIVNSQPLTSSDTDYTVLAKLNGVVLDSFDMGTATADQHDKYIIRVPLDSIGARSPNFARTGDSLEFYLLSLAGEELVATATVGGRGQITALQLGAIDIDGDTIDDSIDNCLDVANPDQADDDGDGIGNSCEDLALGNIASSDITTSENTARSLLSLSGETTLAQSVEAATEGDSTRVGMTAWIGSVDTQVNFAAAADGLAFYRSSEIDCDLVNYASCEDGQMDMLTGMAIADSAATLGQVGYYVLQQGGNTANLSVDAQTFAMARRGQQLLDFSDQLWLIGGDDGIANNGVWSSTDGLTWMQHTITGPLFSARKGHRAVTFDNRMWLIGGEDSAGFHNDVWSTEDGITWTQQTASASFSARANHHVVSFNSQLWLFGGENEAGSQNDVWSSSDGVTWLEQPASPTLPARDGFQVVSFDNQLWLIGGEDNSGYKNDIWSSNNGISWVQQIASAEFSARVGHQLINFDKQLWLLGGLDNEGYSNDVWSSSDGSQWRKGFYGTFLFMK